MGARPVVFADGYNQVFGQEIFMGEYDVDIIALDKWGKDGFQCVPEVRHIKKRPHLSGELLMG
jgi:hypothetical protein